MDIFLTMEAAILLGVSYLLGSVPFGLVLTRMAGLGDIRTIGSGNIGATNVLRTGRKGLALATLLLDAGKGAIAVLLALALSTHAGLTAAAGAAAFLGHCFPVYLGFKGGKGVATFFGTLFAVNWLVGLIAGATWGLMAAVFRISSLAGISAGIAAPIATFLIEGGSPASVSAWPWVGVMAVLILVRHKDNIRRLVAGTEPRIGKK